MNYFEEDQEPDDDKDPIGLMSVCPGCGNECLNDNMITIEGKRYCEVCRDRKEAIISGDIANMNVVLSWMESMTYNELERFSKMEPETYQVLLSWGRGQK